MSFVFRPGWIDWADRTPEMNEAHELALASMPQFRIVGSTKTPATKKVLLTDVWKETLVQEALGYEFPRIRQFSGACVGAGGGNAIFTLSAIEVVTLGDRERIVVPFWLLPYGKSRQRAGFRGQGEGSSGSTFAQAVVQDGVLPADYTGLPTFRNGDGLEWGEQAEYRWSDGAAIPQNYLQEARKYVVKSTALCRTADDVREAILNGYPCTDACGGYVGRPRVQGSGDQAVLLGQIDSSGGHQTSIQGWWEHPSLGELFLYQNQWQGNIYPRDPAGGPTCSTWITARTMNQICQEGETYAFSNFEGFPAQDLERSLFRVIGA